MPKQGVLGGPGWPAPEGGNLMNPATNSVNL